MGSFEAAIEHPQMYAKTLNNLATTYFRLGWLHIHYNPTGEMVMHITAHTQDTGLKLRNAFWNPFSSSLTKHLHTTI